MYKQIYYFNMQHLFSIIWFIHIKSTTIVENPSEKYTSESSSRLRVQRDILNDIQIKVTAKTKKYVPILVLMGSTAKLHVQAMEGQARHMGPARRLDIFSFSGLQNQKTPFFIQANIFVDQIYTFPLYKQLESY